MTRNSFDIDLLLRVARVVADPVRGGEKPREFPDASARIPRRDRPRFTHTRTRYSGESLPALVGCVMQPAEQSLEKETESEEDVDANYGREDVV